jgi:hypothetical protein
VERVDVAVGVAGVERPQVAVIEVLDRVAVLG